jgi:hypothetical protein
VHVVGEMDDPVLIHPAVVFRRREQAAAGADEPEAQNVGQARDHNYRCQIGVRHW